MAEKHSADDESDGSSSPINLAPARKRHKTAPQAYTFEHPEVQVTFLVGPADNPATFLIHKEVILKSSPVLLAALGNENFVEGKTLTYRLTDTTSRAFRLLMQWMYRGSLYYPDGTPVDTEAQSLIELWVLADRLLVVRLQNLVIKELDALEKESDSIPVSSFRYLYENTTANSMLRSYFVATCAWNMTINILDDESFFPAEMVRDIARFSMGKMRSMDLDGDFDIGSYLLPESGN